VSSYWLDADMLIAAHNLHYPLNTRLGEYFWKLIEDGFEDGRVKMARRVFKEVAEGRDRRDELATWLSIRPNYCVDPSRDIQLFAKKIGAYLFGNHPRYEMRHILQFSKGADAWLIAHAAVDQGAVVSNEQSDPDSTKPKIPDVCSYFNVKCIHTLKLVKCLEDRIPPNRCTEQYRH
jgi:hypothetical protein